MYNKDDYKGCVVVQGQTVPEALPKIRERFNGYCIIFSTWQGDEEHYTNDDIVLFNEKTTNTGKSNINLQKITTWNGVVMAQKMGWDRVLKWRSDMYPSDADSIFRTFDSEGINFFAWHDTNGGYVTDYFIEGKCSEILTLFDISGGMDDSFPEALITRNLYGAGLAGKAKCMGNRLHSNIDILWVKNGVWLSSYREHTQFKYEVPQV